MCSPDIEPSVGTLFDSIDAVFDFYLMYCNFFFFDIRCGSDKRSVDDTIIRKYISCNKGVNRSYSVDTLNGGVSRRVRLAASPFYYVLF